MEDESPPLSRRTSIDFSAYQSMHAIEELESAKCRIWIAVSALFLLFSSLQILVGMVAFAMPSSNKTRQIVHYAFAIAIEVIICVSTAVILTCGYQRYKHINMQLRAITGDQEEQYVQLFPMNPLLI